MERRDRRRSEGEGMKMKNEEKEGSRGMAPSFGSCFQRTTGVMCAESPRSCSDMPMASP